MAADRLIVPEPPVETFAFILIESLKAVVVRVTVLLPLILIAAPTARFRFALTVILPDVPVMAPRVTLFALLVIDSDLAPIEIV